MYMNSISPERFRKIDEVEANAGAAKATIDNAREDLFREKSPNDIFIASNLSKARKELQTLLGESIHRPSAQETVGEWQASLKAMALVLGKVAELHSAAIRTREGSDTQEIKEKIMGLQENVSAIVALIRKEQKQPLSPGEDSELGLLIDDLGKTVNEIKESAADMSNPETALVIGELRGLANEFNQLRKKFNQNRTYPAIAA